MRIFPIGCEIIFTRPDDPLKGQTGKTKAGASLLFRDDGDVIYIIYIEV